MKLSAFYRILKTGLQPVTHEVVFSIWHYSTVAMHGYQHCVLQCLHAQLAGAAPYSLVKHEQHDEGLAPFF